MRKCRQCRIEIPRKKDCTDPITKGGFCGVECLAQHSRDKAIQQRDRAQRKEPRRRKKEKNDNDKGHQEGLTQDAFNRMIRLLDDGLPCISCGRHQCGSIWDAGHKRSVGSCPELRFDPRNCHRQGSGCNRANRRPDKLQRRNADSIREEYDQRLRERHGNDMVDWINGPHAIPHFSVDDLKALRKVFNAEARRLERGDGPSRDWRSLDYTVRDLID